MIASILPGTEEYYEVTETMVIIAAVEYEGIIFIVSHSPFWKVGEVGTFPSPNSNNGNSTPGYQKKYATLNNFTYGLNVRYPLITPLFNFDLKNRMDLKAKKSYDGSLDLYFSDYSNPDRVINTGFILSTGIPNDRLIHTVDFNGLLNHIPSSNVALYGDVNIQPPGHLEPGTYFLSLRYLTIDYVKTNFLAEFGPIPISESTDSKQHHGNQEKNWLLDQILYVNKSIQLLLSSVDTAYSYIQVGVTRYSSMTENAPATKQTYLVDNYFKIIGASMHIDITGREKRQSLSFDDIITPLTPYKISKSKVQVGSRLLRANLKKLSIQNNKDIFKAFAQQIVVGEQYNRSITLATHVYGDYLMGGPVSGYHDDNVVYDYVGFFKDQIYPWAVVIQFTDGTESSAYPCSGNIGNGTNGLYKFRGWKDACKRINSHGDLYVRPGGTPVPNPTFDSSQNIVTSVVFDLNHSNAKSAKNFYTNNIAAFVDVAGYYFVRGNRIDNFIAQGLPLHTYYGLAANKGGTLNTVCFQTSEAPDGSGNGVTSIWDPEGASQIPLFRGSLPVAVDQGDSDIDYGVATDYDYSFGGVSYPFVTGQYIYWRSFPSRDNVTLINHPTVKSIFNATESWENRHGIFCPDMLFEEKNISVPDTIYVEPILRFAATSGTGGYTLNEYLVKVPEYVRPNWHVLDLTERYSLFNGLRYFDIQKFIKAGAVFMEHNQRKSDYNISGYFGATAERGFVIRSEAYNRNIGVSRFIGIQDLSNNFDMKACYGSIASEMLSIVTLYKIENNSIFWNQIDSKFNPGVEFYTKVSELQKLTFVNTQPNFYKGDCFLQKTFFRSHRWSLIEGPHQKQKGDGYTYAQYRDVDGCYYQHGLMIGIVTENKYNTGMRNDVTAKVDEDQTTVRYTFFPHCLTTVSNVAKFTVFDTGSYQEEAFQINDGYNITTSENVIKGFEVTEPEREEIKTNRVDASDEHIAGAFIDGYRSIKASTYQDFAIEDGAIEYIGENLGLAFLVQRNAINQIFLSERSVGQTETGESVITGASVLLFSPQTKQIGLFGTQHGSSIIDGSYGTYGVDYAKRVFWMVTTAQAQTGTMLLQTVDLTTKLFIVDEFSEMLDKYSMENTKMDELPDTPWLGSGIVGFADVKFKEIGMTFLFPESPFTGQPAFSRTLMLNEKLMSFRGDYPFAESFYFNVGETLMSQEHYIDQDGLYQIENKVHRYNIEEINGVPNFNTFFGKGAEAKLSFIINGLAEQENVTLFKKIFNSLTIESKHEYLREIIYATQYQEAVYDFTTSKFWENPLYTQHAWNFPVQKQTSVTVDEYSAGSEMTGYWMKVTLVFTGTKDIEIKSVETEFTLLNR